MEKDRQFYSESLSEEQFTVYTVEDYLEDIADGCQRTFEIDPP